MRFNWRNFLAGFVAICGLSACEEDFDPNADYKEIAVVYSFLDSSQPVQYVKVTKAFLNTETSALLIAANEPDSTQFYHPITVELQKLSNNSIYDSTVIATYPLHRVQIFDKEDGAFSTSEQFVFASDSNQVAMADNDLFKVVVTNTATGKQYTSATRIVKKICVHQIGYNQVSLPCDPNASSEPLSPHRIQNLRFDVVPNAEIYKATYYLIYKEHKNGSVDIDTVQFTPVNNSFIKNKVSHTAVIDRNLMFQQMVNSIDVSQDDASTYRTMEPCFVKVTAGGQELARFVEVNNAYSAILQSRPEYTNIRNGTGLFSSRYTQIVRAHFDQNAIDSLQVKYPNLKFAD